MNRGTDAPIEPGGVAVARRFVRQIVRGPTRAQTAVAKVPAGRTARSTK